MTDTLNETATLESPADAGEPPKGIVTRWMKEIDLADRVEKPWRKKATAVLKRFRDEAQLEKGAAKGRKLGTRFNILRPNTRVMKAAIYQETPKPDVRQRHKDRDPLAKAVSEVTERALVFCTDKYDIDTALSLAISDQLLPGRGVVRVRYEPEIVNVNGAEQIAWEKICWDHVQWDDFRRGPGRSWKESTWRAYRHRLTREEAMKKMPNAAKLLKTIDLDCQLEMSEEDERAVKDNPALADVFKRLTVWEVWDKLKREVLFIAPSHKDKPLDVQPDPLGLEGFFDTPDPLYAVEQSDTLEPLEDFRAYADQAKELDNITARIDHIVSQLKIRGLYDSTLKVLADLMSAEDGILLPAPEVSALYNKGGLEDSIWLMPIEKIAQVLQYLYQHREEVKQTIYEITGLSDIMRGSSKASETATAQSIKAQNGAISIQDRRKAVKRYARDLVRIGAEIVCEHFQPQTLKGMSGSDYPTAQEKQQLQAQLQQAQMVAQAQPQIGPDGQPMPFQPDPAMVKRLEMPTWEEIIQVMRSDALRSYRIDVETDETAFGDQQAEQAAVTELLTAVTSFLTAIAPLVQGGVVPVEVAKSMLMMAVRRFRAGRDVEDALDEIGAGPMPPPVDPNAGKMDLEREKMDADRADREQARAFEREKFDEERKARAEQAAFEREKMGADLQRRDRELDFNERNTGEERQSRERMAEMKARPPVQMMFDKDGKTADLAEGTAGVAAAVQQLGEMVRQMVAASTAAELRQSAAIQSMGEQMGQALLAGLTAEKDVLRGKDGKIKRVVPRLRAGEPMQ